MKKLLKTFVALAAVAALGFSFVSCKNNDDDSGSSGGGNGGGGNGGNSTTAITKETIAPKNFKVEQVEGQNKLKFTWEATVVGSYQLINKTYSTLGGGFSVNIFQNGETSYTIDWCKREGLVLKSGEYEFTLVAYKWSDEAMSTIQADPISASVNFEAKVVAPTVPENIEAYQEEKGMGGAIANLNFDKINNNGNYWLWYVSTTNDINTAVIRGLTETSTSRVRLSYDEGEVPANGTTVYVWIKSAVKYIRTEGNEAGSGYFFIKADSDTYSAPTEPFTFVWNLNTGN
ncbi:MAG: hypothetical protein J6I53_01180 [Treponema sp.]|nr:hypothetical protein [Treponema sp.]